MTKAWIRDTAERVLATALMAFLAAFTATDVSNLRAAGVAAVAAALSALKAVMASRYTNGLSPASLAPWPAPRIDGDA